MSFKCGIVGLPNVGKSTLFNALTNSSKAQAGNFPFCTIEPNIGVVPVIDKRLDKLFEISNSENPEALLPKYKGFLVIEYGPAVHKEGAPTFIVLVTPPA